MYRASDLKTGLLHLRGWRQNYDPSAFVIADSLTQTETGEYYQDIHPLLTLENIKAIAPDFKRISYPAWSNATTYRIADRVTANSVTYRAKANNIDKAPADSPDEWEIFDAFSEWLETKTMASIMNAVSGFWTDKMAAGTAKNILENKVLFDGAGRMSETIIPTNSLVGFEIVLTRAKGVSLKIDKIGLQFNQAGTVRIYLMHASQSEPMQINAAAYKDLAISKAGSLQWFDLTDLYLPYISEANDAGGSWFICYDERELAPGMRAINKTRDWSASPCSTCSRVEYLTWQTWSKYLEIHPFKTSQDRGDIDEGFFPEPPEMWDVATNLYTYTQNYGINLQITLECDVTDVIIENRKAFNQFIGLQVATDFIREFAFNPAFRIGRAQQNFSRIEILYELDGDAQSERPAGLVYQRKKALQALDFDTKELSRICFPCSNGGIKYRTA